MISTDRPPPGGDLTWRLAQDLTHALAVEGFAGPVRPSPWALEWRGTVVATAVPPHAELLRWLDLPVVAASPPVQAALADAGLAVAESLDVDLVPLPQPLVAPRPGDRHVVRCDDPGSSGRGLVLGAFLLSWALDVPQAHLALGDPSAIAQARALGCRSEPPTAPPTVVVCGGTTLLPPPVVIDALAAGIPVVGLSSPGLTAVVGDAAVLVDPDDGIATLAGVISALIDDPQLADTVGRRGPNRIEALAPSAGVRSLAERVGRLSRV